MDLYARWLPETDDLGVLRRARVVVGASYVLILTGALLALAYPFAGMWPAFTLNFFALGGAAAALPLLKRRGPTVATHAASFGAWLCLVPSFALSGGVEARFLLWFAVLPLFSGLLGGTRAMWVWGAIAYLTVVGFVVAHAQGVVFEQVIDQSGPPALWAFQYLLYFGAVVGFTSVFLHNTRWAEQRWLASREALAREVERSVRAQRDAELERAHQLELAAFAEELERARDDAVAASEAKSRFLANMSHELRTPLNAILGYTEMVSEELDPEGQAVAIEDLERVTRAGRHLLDLIRDVLDLSKIEAGRMDVDRVDVELGPLLAEVVQTIEPLARQRGIGFEVRHAAALPVILTDRMRLQQILINLLGNAVKFTESGAVWLVVDVVGDTVAVEVQDTGAGIPPEQLAHLFEAFSQGDASTTRRFGGSGLGLAISRHFAQLLGGDIVVHSQVGVGSRFRVVLPGVVRTPDDAEVRVETVGW